MAQATASQRRAAAAGCADWHMPKPQIPLPAVPRQYRAFPAPPHLVVEVGNGAGLVERSAERGLALALVHHLDQLLLDGGAALRQNRSVPHNLVLAPDDKASAEGENISIPSIGHHSSFFGSAPTNYATLAAATTTAAAPVTALPCRAVATHPIVSARAMSFFMALRSQASTARSSPTTTPASSSSGPEEACRAAEAVQQSRPAEPTEQSRPAEGTPFGPAQAEGRGRETSTGEASRTSPNIETQKMSVALRSLNAVPQGAVSHRGACGLCHQPPPMPAVRGDSMPAHLAPRPPRP